MFNGLHHLFIHISKTLKVNLCLSLRLGPSFKKQQNNAQMVVPRPRIILLFGSSQLIYYAPIIINQISIDTCIYFGTSDTAND